MPENQIPKHLILKELKDAGYKLSLKMSTEDWYSNGNSAEDILVPHGLWLNLTIAQQIRKEIKTAKKSAKIKTS